MPRVSLTLSDAIFARLGALAAQNDLPLSKLITRFLEVGMEKSYETLEVNKDIESYCHKLIIEMNTLIKNMSKEILQLGQDDFTRLKVLAENKYKELA